jgi:hypothetical protein
MSMLMALQVTGCGTRCEGRHALVETLGRVIHRQVKAYATCASTTSVS